MLDHVTHLFRFQSIVEEGSLSRAAERLHVSQPALSRSLGVLEQHYGRQLLERHARGVQPTPFGTRVLAIARRVERLWELCEEELSPGDQEVALTLRIGGGLAWRKQILPDILLHIQERFPAIAFEIRALDYGTAADDLREGRFDVLFMGALDRLDLSDLVVHPIITVTDRLVAREGHPIFEDAGADGNVPALSVTRFPWLEATTAPIFGTQVQDALFGALGFRPQPMIRCENLDTSLAILQRSNYIAILPDAMLVDTANPRLIPVPLNIHTNYGLAGMIYRPEMADWPQISELLCACNAWIGRHQNELSALGAVPKGYSEP
ncbi:HTH-type transcriptional regulator ArgP [compost metagenome]